MAKIIDTHAHYDDERFDGMLGEVIPQIRANEVGRIITCGVDYKSSERALEIAEQFDGVYAAVGVYPHETHKQGAWDGQRLAALAAHKRAVAIGEIGLDYYYDDAPRDVQREWVENQIRLALELDMPISFHDRDAHADSLEVLKKYKPRGSVHCFSGSVEMAREIVKIGMYIGIGGVVTFKNARVAVEVVRDIPIEHILLETDAPYMAPVPMRGKTNRSDYIRFIAQRVAEIKCMTADEVIGITAENAERLFDFAD